MSEQQDLADFRFARAQSYFDKSLTIRLLIGAVFAFFFFFFLHFREVFIETLELGSAAKKYVVAQIDFSFPDEEATIILKQEAAQDVGTIWRVNDDQIHHRVTEFQKFVTQSDEGSAAWNTVTKETGFENLALASSLFTDGLIEARFTDLQTLNRIDNLPENALPYPRESFYLFIPPPDRDSTKLPVRFWNLFAKEHLSEENIPQPVALFLINYFNKFSWQFGVDQGAEYSLKKLLQARIPEKTTRVNAGDRIIDKGEKVTARHVSMMQAMKDRLAERRNLLDPLTILGSLLMTLLFIFVGVVYMRENHPDLTGSNRKLSLLVTILLLNILFAKLVELFLLKGTVNLVDVVRFPLFVPFSAILLSSLMNVRIAAFSVVFLSISFSLALAVESIPFVVINIITGMVAILSTRLIRRRKEVFIVCAKAWLASVVVILAFNFYENTAFTLSILEDLSSTFIFMALTAILVVGLLPMLETIFQIITDITLMEFMDPSNELLRRLTIEAPGTYQHSMVVGNLAEAAASAIGANGLFCRVATQYHDIGKLANPQYFTENQLGGIDMHQLLTPRESAQVIIAHVSEGVAMARRVGLPEQFIDIIKEHHGTTLVYYFYHKQIEQEGGSKEAVSELDFRYSGPKPRAKESTIIMIADTLEAASRCLDLFNETTITDLVESLIAQKMEDGQFDESLLTFEELNIVKRVLIKTLLAASHPRVKYPPHHPGEEG